MENTRAFKAVTERRSRVKDVFVVERNKKLFAKRRQRRSSGLTLLGVHRNAHVDPE